MLRRRILSSAMASVMALTSVAVVASADDTAVVVEKQVLERDDLKAIVDKYAADRENALDDYGSVCGEDFLDALEYADNVLADPDAGKDEYTVAAKMVEAAHAHLVKKTQQELRDLIRECRVIAEKGNILNEDLGDLRYTATSFDTFEIALDDAERVLDSSDSRLWTDAWFELDDAKNGLVAMTTVTKSAFRKALKSYEAAIAKEFAYEAWRVGTDASGNEVAYGMWYAALEAPMDRINNKYREIDNIKGLYETSQEDIVQAFKDCEAITDEFNKWTPDDTNRATKANVKTLLKTYHGRLVYDYERPTAIALFKSVQAVTGNDLTFENEDTSGALKIEVGAIDITSADPNIWYIEDTGSDVGARSGKLITAQINAKSGGIRGADGKLTSGVKYYIPLDEEGYWTGEPVVDKDHVVSTKKYQVVNAKTTIDLTQFVRVNAENILDRVSPTENYNLNDVYDHANELGSFKDDLKIDDYVRDGDNEIIYVPEAGKANTWTELDTAIRLAYAYLTEDADARATSEIHYVDTNDTIAEGSEKGSTAEWTMIHRYLYYALSDKYATSKSGLHTRQEVKELIEKSYDLTEKTGDAELFKRNHQNLVTIRQEAISWLKFVNKDKKYIENGTKGDNGLIAHQMYNKLWNAYNVLNNDLTAFNYSFGDVYDYIYKVCSMVDEGTVTLTEELKTALQNTAYYLSTVERASEDETWLSHSDSQGNWTNDELPIDNDAFTSDRFFLAYNRVYTGQTWGYWGEGPGWLWVVGGDGRATKSHIALRTAYATLQSLVKAQTEPEVKLGDVNGDGLVNAMDAAEILKACVSLRDPIDVKVGDVNADGKVDQMDAVQILKQSAGITE